MELHQVKKRYADQEVLQGLQLTVQPGEFVAIVGRSGCGKSTILRLIAGLEEATEGVVLADGERIRGIHPDVRVLFQDARLLPWKRVLANVQIGTGNKNREKAWTALNRVGLANRAKEWPIVLSGGQRQRVALARALAGEPRLLLLDEPLSALDALTRIEMQHLIEELWLEKGFTAILVTHDIGEAITLADRVVMVEQGEIVADWEIALHRPREKNGDFAFYEKLILDRIMGKQHRDHVFEERRKSKAI